MSTVKSSKTPITSSDQAAIDAFLETKEVTKCQPAIAHGSEATITYQRAVTAERRAFRNTHGGTSYKETNNA